VPCTYRIDPRRRQIPRTSDWGSPFGYGGAHIGGTGRKEGLAERPSSAAALLVSRRGGFRATGVAEAERPDLARVDERLLEHLRRRAAERSIEVRRPHERQLLEVGGETEAQRLLAVEAEMLGFPFLPQRLHRARGRAASRVGNRASLLVEPLEGRLVQPIPDELLDDERPVRTE